MSEFMKEYFGESIEQIDEGKIVSIPASTFASHIQKMTKYGARELAKAAQNTGYLKAQFSKVKIQDFRMKDGKIQAHYKVEILDKDEGMGYLTSVFVDWDGKTETLEYSGTPDKEWEI